jgi:hypothetical protein
MIATAVPTFGAPTDAGYTAFRNGYLRALDDITDALRYRWSPAHKNWYTYSPVSWILDDVSVSDTPGPQGYLSSNATDLWLPDVYKRVTADYERYRARWPGLVWTWWGGGDWRVAIMRTGNDRTGPGGTPGTRPPLNPECERRVNEVHEWLRRNVITAADAQRMIRDIVARCTGTRA